MASGSLRSVGGIQVACGWLMQILLGLCVLANGDLHRFYWRYLFFVIASGWLTSILLALFVIASGWLTQILLTLFALASGWLAQFHLVFISFTCSANGWPMCSQWMVHAVSFVLIFSVLDSSVWAALGLKRTASSGCMCFLVGSN